MTHFKNHAGELLALVRFMNPELVAGVDMNEVSTSIASAGASLSSDSSCSRTEAEHSVLTPLVKLVMLRRTMDSVDLKLPGISHVVLRCSMTDLQKRWYKTVLTNNRDALVETTSTWPLWSTVTQLRKACDHPYMFVGAEPEPFEEGAHLWENSGKLSALHRCVCGPRCQTWGNST